MTFVAGTFDVLFRDGENFAAREVAFLEGAVAIRWVEETPTIDYELFPYHSLESVTKRKGVL